MVPWETMDDPGIPHPGLHRWGCEPPVKPGPRPEPPVSEALCCLIGMKFPPAVDQAQSVLDGLKAPDVPYTTVLAGWRLRRTSGQGRRGRQGLVLKGVSNAVEISPCQVGVGGVERG